MTDFATGPVPCLALSPCGRRLAAAAGQNHLALQPVPSLAPAASPAALPPAAAGAILAAPSLTALCFPATDTLYTADARGALKRLHAAADGALAEQYAVPAAHGGAELTGIAAVSAVSHVATSGKDGTVRVWDPETRQSLARLAGHRYEVRAVAAAASADVAAEPGGPDAPVTILASAGRDKTVRLWDVRAASGKPVHVFRGHSGWVHDVALAPGPSPVLVSCAGDKTVRVWDLVAMRERTVMRGHEYRVWGVAVARDGAFVVSGSTDATMRAWKLGENEGECCVFEGHRDSVIAVDVARNGALAVSGCEDGAVYAWDTATLFGRERMVEDEAEMADIGDEKGIEKEELLVALTPELPSTTEAGNKEEAKVVPKQLDLQPLIAESPPLPESPEAPPSSVVPVSATKVTQRQVESASQGETKLTPNKLKAAVSVSAEDLPSFDKSAAELMNALKRIRELEHSLSEGAQALGKRDAEIATLKSSLAEKDAEIALMRKQVESSKNLVNAANVRALLAANPRKADESLDYEEPANKIGAVSDKLSALAARLDAMIATN